jgi:hypothetical protein
MRHQGKEATQRSSRDSTLADIRPSAKSGISFRATMARSGRAGDEMSAAVKQAVIARFALTGEDYGTEAERQAVYDLQGRLRAAIEEAAVGEFDGNLFGGGEVELYAFGPDAKALYEVMKRHLVAFPSRPGSVTLIFGALDDPGVRSEDIDL